MAADKCYQGVLQLGIETDTLDSTGCEVARSLVPAFSRDTIESAFKKFQGTILQIPPLYSALKVQGQKLYKLARKGLTVDRQPRQVSIYAVQVTAWDENKSRVDFTVSCSKGTYIRTLCADIGRELGCGGVLSSLRRLSIGPFAVEQGTTLDRLVTMTRAELDAQLKTIEL